MIKVCKEPTYMQIHVLWIWHSFEFTLGFDRLGITLFESCQIIDWQNICSNSKYISNPECCYTQEGNNNETKITCLTTLCAMFCSISCSDLYRQKDQHSTLNTTPKTSLLLLHATTQTFCEIYYYYPQPLMIFYSTKI